MRLYILIACLSATISTATAQPLESAADVIAQIEIAQNEASKLSPIKIFEEIERLREVRSIKQRNGQGFFEIDTDFTRMAGYAQELKRRRDESDPDAAFHHAMNNIRICVGLQSAQLSETSKALSDCWLESLSAFKIASNGGIGTASFNIGRMYEHGWGVTASKLVAADWYIKSANQHNATKSRENALTALEEALSVVPDHPAALKLRSTMLRK
jgi:TPR repeat protein